MTGTTGRRRFLFRKQHRLTHAREFERAFAGKLKKQAGPLIVHACPNGLGRHRLGLSISGRVGGAVHRHAIKRRLREAFRLHAHELPLAADGKGFDLVIAVRPHATLRVEDYAKYLMEAARQIAGLHRKRTDRTQQSGDGRTAGQGD